MKAKIIINQETQKVKLILDWKAGNIGEKLTASEAEDVVKLIEVASREASREAFKAWLMQFECHDDDIVIDGKTYRFKMVAEKITHQVRLSSCREEFFSAGQRRPSLRAAGRCLGDATQVQSAKCSFTLRFPCRPAGVIIGSARSVLRD